MARNSSSYDAPSVGSDQEDSGALYDVNTDLEDYTDLVPIGVAWPLGPSFFVGPNEIYYVRIFTTYYYNSS